MNTKLIDFYTGTGKDQSGRTFTQILDFNYGQMENIHDWIQWIFPIDEKSNFNEHAPVLDEETITFLKEDLTFHLRYEKAMAWLIKFYYDNSHWTYKDNHNLLRISRFIKSMYLLGYEKDAQFMYRFMIALEDQYKKENGYTFLTQENIDYFKKAANIKT